MSVADIVLLIVIGLGAFRGYRKGVFVEIVGVLALIAALVLGFKFLGVSMGYISPLIGEGLTQRFLPYLSFILIFFPSIFFVNRIGWMLRRAIRFTILGTLDSFAGALLGGFTWAFGLSTMLWLVATIGIEIPKKYTEDSILLPTVRQIAPTVISKVSDWLPAGGNLIKKLASPNNSSSETHEP